MLQLLHVTLVGRLQDSPKKVGCSAHHLPSTDRCDMSRDSAECRIWFEIWQSLKSAGVTESKFVCLLWKGLVRIRPIVAAGWELWLALFHLLSDAVVDLLPEVFPGSQIRESWGPKHNTSQQINIPRLQIAHFALAAGVGLQRWLLIHCQVMVPWTWKLGMKLPEARVVLADGWCV